ncbi:mycothiol maleylpyruvate isomerase, partial [Mycobacterium sp. ITM-2017-0098]
MTSGGERAVFASAAQSFAVLARQIPVDAWDGPGLG